MFEDSQPDYHPLPKRSYLEGIEDEIARGRQSHNGSPRQLAQVADYLHDNPRFESRSELSSDARYDGAESPYRPLGDHDDRQIRTLELYPGSFDDPPRGTLHHCSLDFEYPEISTSNNSGAVNTSWTFHRYTKHALSSESGEPLFYTALSYTWGPPQFDRVFLCDDAPKQITRTLDAALRHLRHPTESVMLWVDQICINQEDDAEKARQVPLMSLVYRRALNTVIWLDAEPDGGAFSLLRGIQQNLGEYALDEQPASVFEHFLELQVAYGFDARSVWAALQNLFGRWWWMRTWIIQEAILSGVTFIRCGHERMSWDELTTCAITTVDSGFYRWLSREVQADVSEVAPGCEVARDLAMQKLHIATMGGRGVSLINAIEDCRYAACTDARDKVYGVLGLCDHTIRPDYGKSVADVFLEAAQVSARELRRDPAYDGSTTFHYHALFRILSCVDHPVDDPSRPSWVPDWSKPRQTTALGFSGSSLVAYNAGDWHRDDIFVLSQDGRSLAMPGKRVGSIVQLGAHLSSPNLVDDSKSKSWLQELLALVKNALPYENEDAEDILTHICVAGKDETGKLKCPPQFAQQMRKLLRADSRRLAADNEKSSHSSTIPDKTKGSGKHKKKPQKPPREKRIESFQDLQLACSKALTNRRYCKLSNGYIGLVPRYVKEGDVVAVFAGAGLPFVVRHVGGDDFQLIGECYVHGIMRGEVRDMAIEDSMIRLV